MARCVLEGGTVRGAVTAIAPDHWGCVSPGIRCNGSPVVSTFKRTRGTRDLRRLVSGRLRAGHDPMAFDTTVVAFGLALWRGLSGGRCHDACHVPPGRGEVFKTSG